VIGFLAVLFPLITDTIDLVQLPEFELYLSLDKGWLRCYIFSKTHEELEEQLFSQVS
jgi:hypothetical protein